MEPSNHRSASIHHNQQGGMPWLRPGLPVELEAEAFGDPYAPRRSNLPLKEQSRVRNPNIIIDNLFIFFWNTKRKYKTGTYQQGCKWAATEIWPSN